MAVRNPMKYKALLPLLAAAFLFGSAAPAGDSWTEGRAKIDALAAIIQAEYFRPVETDEMAREAVKGMLETLDPHSYVLDPESLARMSEEQRGAYFGLGIQIQKQMDRLVVISPSRGRSGLAPGRPCRRSHHPHRRRKHVNDLRPGRRFQAPRPKGDQSHDHPFPRRPGQALRPDHHPRGNPPVLASRTRLCLTRRPGMFSSVISPRRRPKSWKRSSRPWPNRG